eukprot:1274742-Amorphochlora_amoeboformis.AAC.1
MDRKSASSGTTLVLPSSHRQLRACLNCRLVKTAQQWKDNCENGCEFGTTSKFTGLDGVLHEPEAELGGKMAKIW